jgi:precorrin-6B methylase 2
MIFRDSCLVRLTFTALAGAAALCAQRYTDPDTLAPSFPTPQTVVDQMLLMAKIKPGEMVMDLGCGDGRIVIAAAQHYQARAIGIEIRRDIYERTAAHVAAMGLSDQVKIVQGNALRADLTQADVVTLYLLTSSNERLKPILEKQLKPSARVVSHDFEIRGWKAAEVQKLMVAGRSHSVYLYTMSSR